MTLKIHILLTPYANKYFLTVLAIFILLRGIAQPVNKTDSLENLLAGAHDSQRRIEIYTLLAKQYQTIDLDKASGYANQALRLSDETGNRENLAEIYGCMGDIAVMRDSLDRAFELYEYSLKLFEKTGDPASLAGINMVLGNIAGVQGNLPASMIYYQNAVKFATDAGFEHWLDNLYLNMGLVNIRAGKTNEAQQYLSMAARESEKLKDTLVMASAFSNIGLTYITLNDTAVAHEYLSKALELIPYIEAPVEVSNTYMSLSKLEKKKGNYEGAIAMLGKARAELDVKDAEYVGPMEVFRSEILAELGENYLLSGNTGKAMSNYTQAFKLGLKNSQTDIIARAAKGISETWEKKGNIDSAFFFYKIYKSYSDSLLNEESIMKLAYREAQFEYERKIKEEAQAHEMEVERQKQKTTFLVAIIAGLILILAVLALLLQLVRSRVRRIELEQANLRAELELKNKELTTHVLYQLKKNEFILNITKKLRSSVGRLKPENKKVIESVIKELDMDSGEDVWEEFEVRFQQVHNDFYKNLVKKYPDLSSNDLRLSAFLKLNMTTKDIAAITYQTTNSIDVARSRLRQKLGLRKDDNLVSFLSQF